MTSEEVLSRHWQLLSLVSIVREKLEWHLGHTS